VDLSPNLCRFTCCSLSWTAGLWTTGLWTTGSLAPCLALLALMIAPDNSYAIDRDERTSPPPGILVEPAPTRKNRAPNPAPSARPDNAPNEAPLRSQPGCPANDKPLELLV
jgi:hypothetical protein